MIPYDKYLVWKCPKCNAWQGKQNNKWTLQMSEAGKAQAIRKMNLKCVMCNKSTKLKDNKKGDVRVQHRWCKHPHDAKKIIQALKHSL